MVDLTRMEDQLRSDIGDVGLEYLMPQLSIIRNARNIPKDLEDEQFVASKFLRSLHLIDDWLAPVVSLYRLLVEEKENALQTLQSQTSFRLNESAITSWKEAFYPMAGDIPSLLTEVQMLRQAIMEDRERILDVTNRARISQLVSLVVFPFLGKDSLKEAELYTQDQYFGPHVTYHPKTKYTDAFILIKAAEDAFKVHSVERSVSSIERQLPREIREAYERMKYSQEANPQDGLNSRQLDSLATALLGRRLSADERRELNPHYFDDYDRWDINGVLRWMSGRIEKEEDDSPAPIRADASVARQRYLLGLATMDIHRNQRIIGNIPEKSFDLFEAVLAPFQELKQDNIFMQSAKFETRALGLPDQAWIYDYSGIKSEILRSTLLLISDRQPKYDMLESCQRLSSSILSGLVARNDIRTGNYIATDQLPRVSYEYVISQLLQLLEEALVREESTTLRVIRTIFSEEDRSALVTGKKFIPVYQTELDYIPGKGNLGAVATPKQITLHAAPTFDFQFRHISAGGYPWFFNVNVLLEKLVGDAFNLSTSGKRDLREKVRLTQAVFNVDNQHMIVYYQDDPRKNRLSALAFREIDFTQEGINPVEIVFRPQKFLELGPRRNGLETLLENARAADHKDLQTVVSAL